MVCGCGWHVVCGCGQCVVCGCGCCVVCGCGPRMVCRCRPRVVCGCGWRMWRKEHGVVPSRSNTTSNQVLCSPRNVKFRLREGEQPLHKKSQGRLIHVSDFINEEDGQLMFLDETGKIVHDARKII